MLAFFNLMKRLLRLMIDFAFLLQIVATLLVFVFALYWFFNLVGWQPLDFLTPMADNISNFMHAYFSKQMSQGQQADGSLFIFIMLLLVLVGSLGQVKTYVTSVISTVNKLAEQVKSQKEDDFNAQLRAEADQEILAYKNVVLITRLTAKKRIVDDLISEEAAAKEIKDMEERLICDFYNIVKNAPYCKFAKNGDQLVVTLKGFSHVDKLLYYVDKAVSELQDQLKKENWILKTYTAIDAFNDKALLKDVYYDLQILLKLNILNEIICYGNFCNRYYLEPRNLFEAYLKGVYDTTEPENVWTLVKKY